ncbi:MAG: RNA polymerase sigma factor [Bdellovibrionales bacterium]|nr:RNA polymerase sigma factor [Bdellovibrionales bacterium]
MSDALPVLSWSEMAALAQGGDQEVYSVLLEEVYRIIEKFLASRISDPGQREDICQEILLSVHLSLPTFHPKNSFHAWLFTIARRRLIDFLRLKKKRSGEAAVEGSFFDDFRAPEEHAGFAEFIEVMSQLSEQKRQALSLVHLQGLSTSEAAARLEISETNLRVTLHRAVKTVKDALTS